MLVDHDETCQDSISVFNLRSHSKLPRPSVSKTWAPWERRSSVASTSPPPHSVKFPLLTHKFQAERSPVMPLRHNSIHEVSPASSRIPLPVHVVVPNPGLQRRNFLFSRSCTTEVIESSSVLQSRPSSNEQRHVDSDVRFTHFPPLPAIGRRDSVQRHDDAPPEDGWEEIPKCAFRSPKGSSLSSPSSSSSPPNSRDGTFGVRRQDPGSPGRQKCRPRDLEGPGTNLGDGQAQLLFEKVQRMPTPAHVENSFAERPRTSCSVSRVQPQDVEEMPARPRLIRSNTYDILPVVHEEPSEEEAEDDDDDSEAVSEIATYVFQSDNDSSGSQESDADQGSVRNGQRTILLAVKAPSHADPIYGYFEPEASLQRVLDFASERLACNCEGYRLATNQNKAHRFTDLKQTLAQVELKNRTLLYMLRDDEEPV